MKNPAEPAGFLFALFRFVRLIFYAGDFFPFKDIFPRLAVVDAIRIQRNRTLSEYLLKNIVSF